MIQEVTKRAEFSNTDVKRIINDTIQRPRRQLQNFVDKSVDNFQKFQNDVEILALQDFLANGGNMDDFVMLFTGIFMGLQSEFDKMVEGINALIANFDVFANLVFQELASTIGRLFGTLSNPLSAPLQLFDPKVVESLEKIDKMGKFWLKNLKAKNLKKKIEFQLKKLGIVREKLWAIFENQWINLRLT